MMSSKSIFFNIKDHQGRFLKYSNDLPRDPPFIEEKKGKNQDNRFCILINEIGKTQILKSTGIALVVEKKSRNNFKIAFEDPECPQTPRKLSGQLLDVDETDDNNK